jgi:hypothetical protein
MWKNWHVVIAMLVAPVLGVIAWYAVDWFVAERPHAAKAGAAYSLIAKSNCRYDSGECELVNNDFKIIIRPAQLHSDQTTLTIDSEYTLLSVTAALVSNETEVSAVARPDEEGTLPQQWKVRIPASPEATSTLRIAVTAQGAVYYAEVPVTFLDYRREEWMQR